MGNSLGENVIYADYKKLIDSDSENEQVLQAFGQGIGYVVSYLDKRLKSKILGKSDQQFLEGIGYGIGRTYSSLDEESQEQFITLSIQNPDFSKGLCKGLGESLHLLDSILQFEIIAWAHKHAQFSGEFGHGIGIRFPSLYPEVQKYVLQLFNQKCEFTDGLDYGFSVSSHLSPDVQELYRNGKNTWRRIKVTYDAACGPSVKLHILAPWQ